jgi:hypothetical protein
VLGVNGIGLIVDDDFEADNVAKCYLVSIIYIVLLSRHPFA